MRYILSRVVICVLFTSFIVPPAIAQEPVQGAGSVINLESVLPPGQFEALSPEERASLETIIAERGTSPGQLGGQTAGVLPTGAVSCFDYYTFGSVAVQLASDLDSVVSGVPLTFRGTIENTNQYPVVDGAVYLKVFRLSEDGSLPVNGYDVVHQGFLSEGIALAAGEVLSTELTWDVPAALPSGQYQAAFYYSSANRFNLLGLPFTDDVVGNTDTFTVVGELEERVAFEKDTVTVAGDEYYFAAFTPQVSATSAIPVTMELTNTTAEVLNVPVTFTTYAWDQQRAEQVVNQVVEPVTIEAGETIMLEHAVVDTNHAVYLLTAEAAHMDTSSILNVRFTRSGVDTVRLNFPGVMSYPLTTDTEQTVFACVHGAGTDQVVENNRLELALADTTGAVIHTFTYEGDITGEMMAVADTFVPSETYEAFTLTASLYNNDMLVDEVVMMYDCEELLPTGCTPSTSAEDSATSGIDRQWLVGIAAGVAGLALILVLILVYQSRQRPTARTYREDMPTIETPPDPEDEQQEPNVTK